MIRVMGACIGHRAYEDPPQAATGSKTSEHFVSGGATLHRMSRDDPSRWTPPVSPTVRAGGVRGALGGSRLFEQPRWRPELDAFEAFVARPGRLNVEIGFDFGGRLLDHAERFADELWLGLEVREARCLALAERAPSNLHVWRADARTVFATYMPAARVARVDVLFPTPWWDETKRDRRLLLTAPFVEALARSLEPTGVVAVATDVAPYFDHVSALFGHWSTAEWPPCGPVPSRRERVCARDALPVYRAAFSPPS
jgi:tRNA G46 methylase TrmB